MESKRLGRTQDPTILVLTSLTGGPKHGYAIIKDIEEMTGTVFGPGTLYGVLVRLEEEGLIEALPTNDRRRPYRITGVGSAMLHRATADVHEGGDHRSSSPRNDQLIVARTSVIDVALRCYPTWWRERYGDEMRATIESLRLEGRSAISIAVGLFRDAFRSHLQARGMPRTYGLLANEGQDVYRDGDDPLDGRHPFRPGRHRPHAPLGSGRRGRHRLPVSTHVLSDEDFFESTPRARRVLHRRLDHRTIEHGNPGRLPRDAHRTRHSLAALRDGIRREKVSIPTHVHAYVAAGGDLRGLCCSWICQNYVRNQPDLWGRRTVISMWAVDISPWRRS